MSMRSATGFACLLAASYVLALWMTAPAVGFVRDEGYYFKAAQMYFDWLRTFEGASSLTEPAIREHFEYNHEHPALVKLTQGATKWLLSDVLEIAAPSRGYRASGMLFAGLALLGAFALGRQHFGPSVGLAAAVLLALVPRFFFHAHLACFDVAITAMWTWALVAFVWAWRARTWGTATVAGLVFGLALSTKLNALFLPFVFIAVWLLEEGKQLIPRWNGALRQLELPRIPWALLIIAVVGAITFVAVWPWLWHDTFDRIAEYIRFHRKHEHYPVSYGHQILVAPPFPLHFPWVMSLLTLPSPTLLLGAAGLWLATLDLVDGRARAERALLLAGTLLPIVLISAPSTPVFGGTKHWFNALPGLCVLAAWALERGVRELLKDRGQGAAQLAALIIVALPGLAGAIRTHPNGLAFYNELAGGVRGGAELGMQRAFWGYVNHPLLEHLPEGSRVFFNRTNYDSYRRYRDEGYLPRGVRPASSVQTADVALTFEQPEHAETEGEIWQHLGTRPVAGVYQDNVTLGQMYVKDRSSAAPERVAGSLSSSEIIE